MLCNLNRYAAEIQRIGRHDEHSKLSELAAWSGPLTAAPDSLTVRGIPALVAAVKKSLESEGSAPTTSPEVISSVRALEHLAVPPKRLSFFFFVVLHKFLVPKARLKVVTFVPVQFLAVPAFAVAVSVYSTVPPFCPEDAGTGT
jgi:hypothetical protein